jgi:DNA processing protein
LPAHLVGDERREEPARPSLSELATDEQTARMVLSMLVEPNDPDGPHPGSPGAVETLWLAECDGAVVSLSAVDAQVWRARFSAPEAKDVAMSIAQVQQSDVRAPSRSSTPIRDRMSWT